MRGATYALAAILAVAVLVPPETDGASLAGLAALAILAIILTSGSGELPRAAAVLAPAAILAALRARFADAPGESVLPVAIPLLAAALGLTAVALIRTARGAATSLHATTVGTAAFVGARAVYEAVFGLRAAADAVRNDPSAISDAARVLGRLEQGRAYAGFPTPAAAGGFLTLVLPITVGWALAVSGRKRTLLWAAAGIEAAGLVATRSITAGAALLAAVLLAAAVARSRKLALAGAALLLLVAALAIWRSGQVLSLTSGEQPAALRAGDARIALAMAADHPWMGVGPGGYGEAVPIYRRAGDHESRHAHMTPLEWAAEWGVPAGAVLSLLWGVVFLGPLFRYRSDDIVNEGGVAIGLAALAIQNLADFTMLLPSIVIVACVLRGTLVCSTGPSVALRGPRLLFATTALAVAMIAGAAGMSHAALDTARELALSGETAGAESAARRAVRWAPWSADASMFLAQAAGDLDEADRAVGLVPQRASARDVRARARLSRGDVPGAFADLDMAARLNPANPAYAEARDRTLAALPRYGTELK